MAATDLLTLDEAKLAIAISDNNTAYLDTIETMVSAVSAMIDSFCGPVVERQIVGELHRTRTRTVWLKCRPVASITQVRSASGGVVETVPPLAFGDSGDGYRVDLEDGRLDRTEGCWGDEVEVTYTAGRFATTDDVAPKFKECAAAILRRLWKREAPTWAQSSNYFESLDVHIQSASPQFGFFRIAQPIIDEMLWDERLPPAVA